MSKQLTAKEAKAIALQNASKVIEKSKRKLERALGRILTYATNGCEAASISTFQCVDEYVVEQLKNLGFIVVIGNRFTNVFWDEKTYKKHNTPKSYIKEDK